MGRQRLYSFWGAPLSMTQVKIPTTLHNPLFIVCKQRMWNDIQFFHHPASLFSYFGFMSSQRRMSSPAGACWTTTYCCATMLLLTKEVMVVKLQRCECFFGMAQVDPNPNQSWRLKPKAQSVIVLCLFSVCVGSITKHLKKKILHPKSVCGKHSPPGEMWKLAVKSLLLPVLPPADMELWIW